VTVVSPSTRATWTPIRVSRDGGPPTVDWCELGPTRFTDPFFHETVERVLRRPAASLLRPRSPLADLAICAEDHPGLAPAGFVFHTSRSGSTLLARMLGSTPRHRVLSEPDPVDHVLRAGEGPVVSPDDRTAWLRSMVSVLGRPAEGEERLFVKLEAWHILEFPAIRRAFPQVPWVFSCRDPLEVLVSHARNPGIPFLPGSISPSLLGVELTAAASMPPDGYRAFVLDRLVEAAAAHLGDGGLVVDHTELPAAADRVLDHFGVDVSGAERAAMLETAGEDAKRPGRRFEPDSEVKRAEADDGLRILADLVRPGYERLLGARVPARGGSVR